VGSLELDAVAAESTDCRGVTIGFWLREATHERSSGQDAARLPTAYSQGRPFLEQRKHSGTSLVHFRFCLRHATQARTASVRLSISMMLRHLA
jgi:hypothetical protein